ncbi:putative DNA (cytosine-5-)-methyltransferase [Helianthus debilis subsp. tardiflorus]
MNRSVVSYVNWQQVCSTNNRGRKEIRFYLKRPSGTYDLAVIGKEKKLGHRLNTTSSSEYRFRYANRDELMLSSLNLPSKLRSRREVVDWLNSVVVSDGSFPLPQQPVNGNLSSGLTLRLKSGNVKGIHLHKTGQHTAESVWVGSAWTCKKKCKHFGAYTRSGVKISVHDFVYVLAEESKRLVAYINDLYEDPRGNKTAVVQWFHKIDELGLDSPCTYHNNKEIFFSLCLQDLSIECIDGLATVLSPQHYDNFLKSHTAHTISDRPFVCQKQYENEVVSPLDVTQVKGYWNQNILRLLCTDDINVRPKKRLRKLVDDEYSIGSEIEVLSQDSGIRGVWFKAVVIKKHKDKLKVRYQDIKDAADESINLEEWIVSSRVAVINELGIRHDGRMTIRPTRSADKIDVCSIDVGCVVDAWLHDGWWEGIVVHKESDDRIHVYFPGEKNRLIFGCKDLRYSQEWLGDSWKKMKDRPDVLHLISCATETKSETTKSNDNVSGLSSEEDRDFAVDLLANLNWNWSTKKRHSRSICRDKSLVAVGTRKRDSFPITISVKSGCKFTCARVASPLTGLVM